ncbi:MAG: DUF262 domain-containing protein [Nitrospirota bacterium]
MKKPLSWFLDVHRYGQLDLEPPYQRRSVWTLKDRKFFLDTVFRKYPCPAVFLHKDINYEAGKMNYHVVDGKQRLETVILFFQNELAIDPSYGNPKLNGKKWKDIENDPDLKTAFLNYELTVEYIDTNDKYVINEVFERLNRTSRKLERQELRHAKYDGWFINIAEREAEKEEWERLGIVTKARMRRMKDVQCVSELLAVLLKNRIFSFNQEALDIICAEYDSPHETFSDFDEQEFLSKLVSTKEYILRMEDHNKAVSKYAKGFNDFYSLWTFVALNQDRLDTPEIIAEKYAEFMKKVATLVKIKDMKLLREYENGSYPDAYTYLKNSGHASTDQLQRETRNAILESNLLATPIRNSVAAPLLDEVKVVEHPVAPVYLPPTGFVEESGNGKHQNAFL